MSEPILEEWELIEQLVDSFASRHRAGDRPSIDEYTARHPALADKLRELLPAVALLERHAASPSGDSPRFAESNSSTSPPREIGDFTILREVGRGGMGIVYEAMQKSLGRHVALKVLSLPTFLNPKHLERFRFEARAAARLQHRHIVPIFGIGEIDGLHYYAMQFIYGQSLHEVLCAGRELKREVVGNELQNREATQSTSAVFDPAQRDSPEHFRKVAGIGREVAEALSYAHGEGVLHRDIKPSNLLLDTKGNMWVADFGLARVEGNEGLTETGDFVGTLRYMAPERLEGVLDRRSDIYSLGATLYELLTFEPFYESNSNAQLDERILNDSPLPPSRLQRSIPRDLETIVLKAIAKEPAARYRTADEMAEDLRRFLVDKPILARRPSTIEQLNRWCRRNRMVAALTGAVVGLLVAAIVILTWSNYRIRNEGAIKDRAIASARNAVHQLLTRVASEKLNDIPMSHPIRVDLLNDAVGAYEGLLALGDQNVPIQLQLAEVLHTISGLQRELDRNAEAADALQRSATIYASLIDIDPNPPVVLEALAVAQMDLAYTWQFDTKSPEHQSFPIEEQYRRALSTFESIEHSWPQRRQPVTLCLRSLAEFAHRRGEKATAEKLWLDSIARGDAYCRCIRPSSRSEMMCAGRASSITNSCSARSQTAVQKRRRC